MFVSSIARIERCRRLMSLETGIMVIVVGPGHSPHEVLLLHELVELQAIVHRIAVPKGGETHVGDQESRKVAHQRK